MQEKTIGIAGSGKMGSAFARRLMQQDYRVSVWDRSARKLDAAAAAGSRPFTSLDELVKNVDVVIVMLWGDDVAREVTLKQIVPAMRPTQLLIEMSTLSPQMYETLERAASQHEVPFVAAPVVGNPDVAQEGSLTVLAGGDSTTVQRASTILSSLGNVVAMPSVRASGFLKLANNTLLGVFAESLGELLELSGHAGIDRSLAVRTFVGTLQRSAAQKLPQLLEGDTKPRFSLSALLKDLHLARESAHSLHVSLPMLEAVVPEAERIVEDGSGDSDYIVLALDRPKQTVRA